MITDNLAPLFGTSGPGVRFRQGTVQSWNPATGENTVDVAGGTLTNVPILNTGEAIALKAGHIVGLLGQGASWFIIGRVTPPNDPNFAGASVAFGSALDFRTNFTQPAVFTQQASKSIPVPAWADEAAVTCMASVSLVNSTAARVQALAYAGINGLTGSAMTIGIDSDVGGNFGMGALAAFNTAVITDPGPTITVQAYADCTSALAASPFNVATVNAIAIFRSIA